MDFYEQLGISRDASIDDIKIAYRGKARDHHPDMHSTEEDKKKHIEIFKKATEAFDILSDPIKKSLYDAKTKPYKKPIVKTKDDFKKEKDKSKFEKSRLEKEPMDINCMFYGGEHTGRNIMMHVKCTSQELKNGCTKSVVIKKRDFCSICGGDGEGPFVCPKCNNNKNYVLACNYCDFTGQIYCECPHCNGSGMGLWMLESLSFKIAPNTQSGYSIIILGRGEEAASKPPGNVRIVVI